ncbi:MAG: AsmA family protein [Rikenellaceae bacterium]|nr:AsmA family protein [Rikenellaceae bacterium]
MKRFLKIFAIVLALLFAIVLIIPSLLSGKISDIVKREANAMLNAKVEFAELDISLLRHFPKASLSLLDFSVTGVGDFEGQRLVSGERIEVAVDLFSIFGESFEVSKVWLLSPEIHGVIAKNGAANWEIFSASPEEEVVEGQASEPSSFKLSLKQLAIENAKIYYTDNTSAMHFHTAPVSLTLSGDLSAANTTLNLSASAADITFTLGSDSYASGLTATLNGSVGADLVNNRYTLSSLQLAVNSVKAALDGWVALEDDDIDTEIVLDCSGNNFKDILSLVPAFYTKDFKNLTAAGGVSLTGAVKGRMSGENYPAFALKLKVADGSFKYADLPKSVTAINIAAAVENKGGSLDATTVDVSRFGATFGGQSFTATLKASTPLSDLNFAATAKGKVDLGAIKDIYPLEDMALAGIITADASAAGKLSDIDRGAYDRLAVSGQLGVEGIEVEYGKFPTIEVNRALATLSPSKMALESLSVKIGKSDITATGNLTNYWGYLLHDKVLSGRLDVNSQLLDLNELMAAMSDEAQTEQEEAEQSQEQVASEPLSVIEVPKNLDLALDCKFSKVLYDKMVIDNLAGAATVRGGVLSLDNLGMNMFDGTAKASAAYSTANIDSPRLRLNATFNQASFKTTAAQVEMIEKIVPLFNKIEGTYTMSLNADMALDQTMSPVLKSVNGSGKITSGNFKLSNIPALTALAKSVGNGVDLNTIQSSEATVISFTIENGNVITKPFDIKLGKTKLTLSGLTGLDQTIDYKVAVALPQITLHAKIGGTFTSPKIGLDTAKSAEAALEKAGINKQEVIEEVSQKVDSAKQALIAEAEARAAKIVAAAREEADKLVAKATNPITKIAAKAAADKLIAEAERKANEIVEQARK